MKQAFSKFTASKAARGLADYFGADEIMDAAFPDAVERLGFQLESGLYYALRCYPKQFRFIYLETEQLCDLLFEIGKRGRPSWVSTYMNNSPFSFDTKIAVGAICPPACFGPAVGFISYKVASGAGFWVESKSSGGRHRGGSGHLFLPTSEKFHVAAPDYEARILLGALMYADVFPNSVVEGIPESLKHPSHHKNNNTVTLSVTRESAPIVRRESPFPHKRAGGPVTYRDAKRFPNVVGQTLQRKEAFVNCTREQFLTITEAK